MALFPNTTTVPASSSAASITASDVTAAVQDLQTSASPQFAGIQLGHASDTTLTRSAAGQLAVEGVDVVTLSATQTLTNKTLTAPRLASGGFIADANGNEGLILVTTASAVNEVTLTNAATGGNPKLEATGGDTNIGLDVQTKGTGVVRLLGNATQPAEVRLFEDTDNGTNYVGIKSPASVASNLTFQLPSATGAGKVLTDVNGDGVLTMETVSATNSPMVLSSVSGTNTITATGSTALVSGMTFAFVPANTNSGAVTLNISSGGAIAIKRADGTTALSAGDLPAGVDAWVRYDGTVFRLLDAVTLAGVQILTNKVLTSPVLNGNPQIANGSYLDLRQPVVINANIPRFASGIGQIHAASSTYNCVVEGAAVGYGGICADDPATASNPKIKVHGLSHSTKPGSISIQSGALSIANDGAWHAVYSLAEGSHHGNFFVYTSITSGHGRYGIHSTTLQTVEDKTGASLFVDSGFVGSAYIGLRVNSGSIEIYVGTGVTAGTKISIRYEGIIT